MGGVNSSWYSASFIASIAFSAVPLFFMITGYLMLNSEKSEDTSYLKHHISRMGIPLFFWSLLYIIADMISKKNLNIKNIVMGVLNIFKEPADEALWYIYVMIALYLISPILYNGLKCLNRKSHILLFSLIMIYLLFDILKVVIPLPYGNYFDFYIFNVLKIFRGHIVAILLGYYLGKNEKKVSNILLSVIACFALGIIVIGTFSLSKTSNSYITTFQNQSGGLEIILAACLFMLAKQNLNKDSRKFGSIIKQVAKLSLTIYLSHITFIGVFSFIGINPTSTFGIILESLLIVLCCFVLAKSAASIKWSCYMVNGISFKEACETVNWQYTIRKFKELINYKE